MHTDRLHSDRGPGRCAGAPRHYTRHSTTLQTRLGSTHATRSIVERRSCSFSSRGRTTLVQRSSRRMPSRTPTARCSTCAIVTPTCRSCTMPTGVAGARAPYTQCCAASSAPSHRGSYLPEQKDMSCDMISLDWACDMARARELLGQVRCLDTSGAAARSHRCDRLFVAGKVGPGQHRPDCPARGQRGNNSADHRLLVSFVFVCV